MRMLLAALFIAGVLAFTGCAATPSVTAAGEPGLSPAVPAQVDDARWDGVVGAPVIEANVTGPTTLAEMAELSELVVIARVKDQGPFRDHDWIATESILEIIDVLKGERPETDPRLYTIGKPIYLEGHYDVEGVADPPLFDQTYLMFLARYPEIPNATSELVPVDDVWTTLGHAAFAKQADGVWQWNGEGEFPPVTAEELRAVLGP